MNRTLMRRGQTRLHTSLVEAKIQHVFYESSGTDHEWQTWRRASERLRLEALQQLAGKELQKEL
jgi:enterochelin esterase-like enzyme